MGRDVREVGIVDTTPGIASSLWDARAELDVALLIKRYLSLNPPPVDAVLGDDLRAWASGLEQDARARLRELEAVPLRAV